jgi:hypothetical protein
MIHDHSPQIETYSVSRNGYLGNHTLRNNSLSYIQRTQCGGCRNDLSGSYIRCIIWNSYQCRIQRSKRQKGSQAIHFNVITIGLLMTFLHRESNYISDRLSLLGTIILWVLWPSFNSALAPEGTQVQSVINTILAISSSSISAAYFNMLVDGSFSPEIIRNASLSGTYYFNIFF